MSTKEPSPSALVVLGIPFHNVSFDEAVDWIAGRVRVGQPCQIVTANLDFVMQAWRDPAFHRLLLEADLVLADGFPVVKLAPFFGPPLKGRVTGSDLVPLLAARAAKEGFRLYGLGGAPGVAGQALDILRLRHPGLKVAGSYSPPFGPLDRMDHAGLLLRLEGARPDILLVALGSPKQDRFIRMHLRDWSVPVAIGVGAALDFVAGAQKRAPAWMRRAQLEWFWRLCNEPVRLYGRYLSNLRFLLSAIRKMILIHRMADGPVAARPLDDAASARLAPLGAVVEPYQPIKGGEAAREWTRRLCETAAGRSIVLDIHSVPWLDSLELGALLHVDKCCRAAGRRLVLCAPRPKVRRLLETCRLIDYFSVAANLDEAVALLPPLS